MQPRILRSLALALLALACVVSPARAQFFLLSRGNEAGPSAVHVSKRNLDAYSKILALDPDQREVAQTLADGYREASKALSKDIKERAEALQRKAMEDQNPKAMMKEFPKIIREFETKCRQLEDTFFSDLKATLTPAQAEKYDAVERHRRRDLYLRLDLVRGQNINLLEVLAKVKPAWEKDKALAEIMQGYERSVDAQLKTFETVARDSFAKMMDKVEKMEAEPGPDQEKELLAPFDEGGRKIRDLNLDTARQLRTALRDDDVAKLNLEINRLTFPSIYRQSHPERAIAAFEKPSELDESQRSRLDSLKASYVKDLALANAKWSKALSEKEEKAGGKQAMMRTYWEDMGKETDLTKARDERKALDKRTLERLTELLREDQRTRIPVKNPEESNLFEGWAELDLRPGTEESNDD